MRPWAVLPLLWLALAGPALAHNMKVFAAAAGGAISGKVYFVGGGAAMAVPVTLRAADGKVLATVTTAADGSFTFAAAPSGVAAVVAVGGDGHMAEFPLLPAAAVAPSPASASDDAALARQLLPLAERLEALESALRLRDVLGGLGYILGLFGLWAWMKSRRGRGA